MHSWQLVHWFFLDCGTGTGARAANIWTGLCRRRPRGEGDAVNLPPGRRLSIRGARAVTRFIPFSAACPALCGGHGVSLRSYSPHCFLLEARSGVLWHCAPLEPFSSSSVSILEIDTRVLWAGSCVRLKESDNLEASGSGLGLRCWALEMSRACQSFDP
ncbi:hypothetical protein K456DRAFT_1680355 [Colletotrichum gloeosporioides 23]|nr:hypothetical protein K456DRAFT_1680355 [Colletotrichum gloeosporioides 23]